MSTRAACGFLALLIASAAASQETINLNRSEVAALKAKVVAVQEAMRGEPPGYVRKEEDSYFLPTAVESTREGKFWPVVTSVQMRFGDQGTAQAAASIEQYQQEFMARYTAALASGDETAIEKLLEEMTAMQTAAAAAALAPAAQKDDMQVYVQLNMNPIVSIDPDAVVLEQAGVIALRQKGDPAGQKGQVTVYLDPVALANSTELSSFELRTDQDGVTNRTGVYHVVIRIDGALADIESWVQTFDLPAMLAVIDPR